MGFVEQIDWIAVLACGAISIVVGGIYYAPPVLGKAWMKESGITEADFEGKNPFAPMIKAFFASLILGIGLQILLAHFGISKMSLLDGFLTGVGVALLIVAAGSYPNYTFEQKSFKHYLIHTGNQVLTIGFMSMAIVALH